MQAPNNLVTIAIPFYNAEFFLAKAIDSVLWQTYTNWQLILLDDGSTDSSLTIANAYAAKDKRITVISDGQNKNLGFRLNQIPFLVTTEYLARMDADDIMHPERIEKQINTLIKYPEIDVLGTNAYTINEKDEVVGMRQIFDQTVKLKKVKGFTHPTIMAKTEWFKNNPYNAQAVRIEDAELWYRTRDNSNFMILMEPLLFYREFGGDYYKKYIKVVPSLIKLVNKYKYNFFWSRVLLQSIINIPVYFFFERILKSSFMLKNRNKINYNVRDKISNFI